MTKIQDLQLLLDAVKSDHKEQVADLQEQIDALKEDEFKEGDWVMVVNDHEYYHKGTIGRLLENGSAPFMKSYQPDKEGEIVERWAVSRSDLRLATESEIKEHLIAEAKRRGFKSGVRFKCAYSGIVSAFGGDPAYFGGDSDHLTDGSSIYIRGKWAEIIKSDPIIIKTSEGNKEVEFLEDTIRICDTTWTKDEVENLLKWKEVSVKGKKALTKILKRWK